MNPPASKFSAREAGFFCWSERSRATRPARGEGSEAFTFGHRPGETFARHLNCAELDFLAATATQEPRTRLFDL